MGEGGTTAWKTCSLTSVHFDPKPDHDVHIQEDSARAGTGRRGQHHDLTHISHLVPCLCGLRPILGIFRLKQVPVGEGGTTAWKTCSLTPRSTVTLYLDVCASHAVRR